MRQEPGPDAVLARHQLRLALRSARERAGLTQVQTATHLRWSKSKVLRIEGGQIGVSHTDLAALLALYGLADPQTVADLSGLAAASRHQPWGEYRGLLRAEELTYLSYECAAAGLRGFQDRWVHELLQTEDYARHLILALDPDTPSAIADRLVEARMARQELLRRPDPPTVTILLDEPAVVRPPAWGELARKVLQAQLDHLRDLAQLPHVTIGVVPISHGAHPGLGYPFMVVDLPGQAGSVVYWDGDRPTGLIRERPEDVAFHARLVDELLAAAVGVEQF